MSFICVLVKDTLHIIQKVEGTWNCAYFLNIDVAEVVKNIVSVQ